MSGGWMRRPDVRSPGTDRSPTAPSPRRSGAASAEHGFPDETPAGTGYLTVAVITLSAILTAIMTLRTPQRGADDVTTPDQHSLSSGNASAETHCGGPVDVERAADLYAQGFNLRQISAELGVPWTAVGHQLRRARRHDAPRRPSSTPRLHTADSAAP
jgi:hypothetical protein